MRVLDVSHRRENLLPLQSGCRSSSSSTVFSACRKGTEARKAARRLLRINPKESAESFAAKLPYKDPKAKELVPEALRRAGL